jgi:hypothetical protein
VLLCEVVKALSAVILCVPKPRGMSSCVAYATDGESGAIESPAGRLLETLRTKVCYYVGAFPLSNAHIIKSSLFPGCSRIRSRQRLRGSYVRKGDSKGVVVFADADTRSLKGI